MTQFVHLFGGAATTSERSKDLLGGKGANHHHPGLHRLLRE